MISIFFVCGLLTLTGEVQAFPIGGLPAIPVTLNGTVLKSRIIKHYSWPYDNWIAGSVVRPKNVLKKASTPVDTINDLLQKLLNGMYFFTFIIFLLIYRYEPVLDDITPFLDDFVNSIYPRVITNEFLRMRRKLFLDVSTTLGPDPPKSKHRKRVVLRQRQPKMTPSGTEKKPQFFTNLLWSFKDKLPRKNEGRDGKKTSRTGEMMTFDGRSTMRNALRSLKFELDDDTLTKRTYRENDDPHKTSTSDDV